MPSSRSVSFGYGRSSSWDTLLTRMGFWLSRPRLRQLCNGRSRSLLSEIKSFFLGLAGYYQMFIQDLSKVVVPLTRLTRKGVDFHRGPE